VFWLTFGSYTCFHATRKILSVIKSDLDDYGTEGWFGANEDTKLGALDTAFLFCYATGMYITGALGDRYDLRIALAIGMLLSGSCVLLFGLGGVWDIHSIYYFAGIWGLNGLVQATGWPFNVGVMGSWFGPKERGLVMGFWTANISFGNIIGTLVGATVAAQGGSWELSVVVCAALIAVQGVIIFFFLVPSPVDVGLPDPNAAAAADGLDESLSKDNLLTADADAREGGGSGGGEQDDGEQLLAAGDDGTDSNSKRAVGFLQAWMIPGVIPYAFAYANLKSVNYAMFFWLPLYLKETFKMTSAQADWSSMLYDVGQILGGATAGYITDIVGVRSPTTVAMMALSTVAVFVMEPSWVYGADGPSLLSVRVLLFVLGFMVGGPSNLIAGCISADLGNDPTLKGNARAMSTVTGIIDGTGSVGAALVQYLVGYLKTTTVTCVDTPQPGRPHEEVCLKSVPP
jgi:OPA family glycerol-3-phosphate transporter-like MFS transporter 3